MDAGVGSSSASQPSTEQAVQQNVTEPNNGPAAGPTAEAEPKNDKPPVATGSASNSGAVERLVVPDVPGDFKADGTTPGLVCCHSMLFDSD